MKRFLSVFIRVDPCRVQGLSITRGRARRIRSACTLDTAGQLWASFFGDVRLHETFSWTRIDTDKNGYGMKRFLSVFIRVDPCRVQGLSITRGRARWIRSACTLDTAGQLWASFFGDVRLHETFFWTRIDTDKNG